MKTFTALVSLCAAGRVWTICKGKQFRPPTPAEEANEVQSVRWPQLGLLNKCKQAGMLSWWDALARLGMKRGSAEKGLSDSDGCVVFRVPHLVPLCCAG